VSKFRRIVLPKTPEILIPVDSAEAITEPSADSFGAIVDPSRLTEAAPAPSDLDAALAALAPAAPVPAANYPKLTSQFLLAGKALFTVTNPRGDHFTFKVRKVTSDWPKGSGIMTTSYFVSVKSPGGMYPYRYIGLLNSETGGVKCTGKSEFIPGTTEYNVAAWACGTVIKTKNLPDGYNIEHAGACGRCGKTLTDPESIELGIGPECRKVMGI